MKKLFAILFCFVMVFSFSFSAFAVKRPVGEMVHEVILRGGLGVEGVLKPDIAYEIKDGNKVTVKIDPSKGDFDNWSIYIDIDNSKAKEGEHYTIVSGSLTSDTITIIPKTDLIICGNYDGKITDPNTGKPADPEAPETGSSGGVDEMLIIGGAILILAATLLVIGLKRKARQQ